MCQVKTHECFTRHKNGLKHCCICLGTGVGLYVCILGSEQLLDACNCKTFSFINYLATSVITLAGITFGILVCQA